jgi:multimeric flavodoxin WrbA
MNIAVLAGSPKGEESVTLQYVLFLRKKFPEHRFTIIPVLPRLTRTDVDPGPFNEAVARVRASDVVLWAFPVYSGLVPSHYKRFIELVLAQGAEAFRDKSAAVFSTSIHFNDHTAHDYLRAVCEDLGMRFAGSFSAAMYDLLREPERRRFLRFARETFHAVASGIPSPRAFPPLEPAPFVYTPVQAGQGGNAGGKRALILADTAAGEGNIGRMVGRFVAAFPGEAEVVNLHDLDIKGGCLGCIRCGYDNRCAYGESDGFMAFYNGRVKTADIVVFAGTIRDRYLSWKWKEYFDRAFFNNHVPSLAGKQVAFLISGPLSRIAPLRELFTIYAEWQQANLVDFVTDECGDSAALDLLLDSLAGTMARLSREGYVRPMTCRGVGGLKIFRDQIWGRLRFPFVADHRYYRKHGWYDFPRKEQRLVKAVFLLLAMIPSVRKEIYERRMKAEMIKPLEAVVREA